MGLTTIRVAMIGAGAMARAHLQAFAALEGVELAGICSGTRSKADALATKYSMATVTDNIAALYAETGADAVVICVPVGQTAAVYEEVIRYDWTVLVEKPLGLDLEEARRLSRQASTLQRRVHVALNRRFLESTGKALQVLQDVPTDEPRLIEVHDQQNMAAARAYGHPEIAVRNFMYVNSVHLVDYLTVFGRGCLTSVSAIIPWQQEGSFVTASSVHFSSGDVAIYRAVWQGPGPWAVSVSCPSLRLELRPLEHLQITHAGNCEVQSIVPAGPDTLFKPGLYQQAEAFVSVIRGEAVPLLADHRQALKSMQLIHDLYPQ